MTKKQAERKTRSLIVRTAESMRGHLNHLLRSGAIPLDDYEDTYELPKAIMTALCENAAEYWRPSLGNKDARIIVANLRHF